jgi:putative spermidine/putrescine transport system permease protein
MLPIRMWGMMESTLDVRIAAIAGVLILATLVLVIVMDRLTGLTKRMSV